MMMENQKHRPLYRDLPESECALLCIHGILGTPRQFDGLLKEIPADWTIHNILLAGHGGSARDFSRASMAQWVEQVSQELEQLSCRHRRVYVLAHSMGTLLALEQAALHPERVQGMLLLAVPLYARPRLRFLWQAARIGLGLVREDDPVLAPTARACSIAPERRVWRYAGWIPRYLELFGKMRQVRDLLGRVKGPCTAFQAGRDELVSPRSTAMLERYPAIRVIRLPSSGHYACSREDEENIRQEMHKLR